MTLSDLARVLNLQARQRWPAAAHLPALMMMSDDVRLPDPVGALAALGPNDAMVLRHYDDPNRDRLAHQLASACRIAQVRLLVAGDFDLAVRVGAHGVHLAEGLAAQLNAPVTRPQRDWIVTVAAHDADGLTQASQIGADAALLSPVFPTKSHPGMPTLGAHTFGQMCAAAELPVYALGGVNADNGRALRGSGAIGIAAIGGNLAG